MGIYQTQKVAISVFIILISLFIYSCESPSNHYHDGKYSGEVSLAFFMPSATINVTVNGSTWTVHNSFTGITEKHKCWQYPDRIELDNGDGTRVIAKVLEDNSLYISDRFILKKDTIEGISNVDTQVSGR